MKLFNQKFVSLGNTFDFHPNNSKIAIAIPLCSETLKNYLTCETTMLRNFNNVGFKTEIYREASNVLTPKYGHVVIFVVFWET